MLRRNMVAMALLLAPAAASAQSMNAEAFYRSAMELKAKGPLAVFSMDKVNALTAEAKASAVKARAARDAAKRAGRTPRFCPPDGPQSMASSEYLDRLSAIPAAARSRIDMTEATTRILAKKYPCAGARQ